MVHRVMEFTIPLLKNKKGQFFSKQTRKTDQLNLLNSFESLFAHIPFPPIHTTRYTPGQICLHFKIEPFVRDFQL